MSDPESGPAPAPHAPQLRIDQGARYIAPGSVAASFEAALDDWRTTGKVRQLWGRNPGVWTGTDEGRWLGWLDAVQRGRQHLKSVSDIGQDGAAFTQVVVLGMGGSSLAPWVLRETFGTVPGHPELFVLDSVDPAQILDVERTLDLPRTLFIVASKSGGTAEPLAFHAYFFDRLRAAGVAAPGSHFIAITDPGTSLVTLAADQQFRHVALGPPDVGGRFSALTNFGLVPAALMGLDVSALLDRADSMVRACSASVPPDANPGVALGVLLATAAQQGRDKLTFAISPTIAAIGSWLEQLVAESTGKNGLGIVPVDAEPLGPPEAYGPDRVFVHIATAASQTSDEGRQHEELLTQLEEAGHPIVRIVLNDAMDIGQEFFRWQVATAVAGSVLGVNPFNQPDVEAAKIATRAFMRAYEQGEPAPTAAPVLERDGLRFYAEGTDAAALAPATTPVAIIAAHLARLKPGDYFAVNAFLSMSEDHARELQAIRRLVRDHARVATTVGYGPRFLHSTGQLHKGGPDSGVFLVLVSDDAEDVPVPGTSYTFGAMKRAQALGDCQVLSERGRRLLRIEIGAETLRGLRRLRGVFEEALCR